MSESPKYIFGQYVYLSARMTDPKESYEIVSEWGNAPAGVKGWIVRSSLGNEFSVLESEISETPVTDDLEVYRIARW